MNTQHRLASYIAIAAAEAPHYKSIYEQLQVATDAVSEDTELSITSNNIHNTLSQLLYSGHSEHTFTDINDALYIIKEISMRT